MLKVCSVVRQGPFAGKPLKHFASNMQDLTLRFLDWFALSESHHSRDPDRQWELHRRGWPQLACLAAAPGSITPEISQATSAWYTDRFPC